MQEQSSLPSGPRARSKTWIFTTDSSASVSSSSSEDLVGLWKSPPKRRRRLVFGFNLQRADKLSVIHIYLRRQLRLTVPILLMVIILIMVFLTATSSVELLQNEMVMASNYTPIPSQLWKSDKQFPDPVLLLAKNSYDRHTVDSGILPSIGDTDRPRAAMITLVRNSELEGIRQSMIELEARWNWKYQYPWIFFNDELFTEEFKAATSNLTLAKCYYEVVPKAHWSLPDWINEDRFMTSKSYLGHIGVGKGWLTSYHHMCRWNSGFFYKHPRLKDFDWYWRVEPDVHYFCDINYDVFRFMRDNNLKYGFNMAILDDARSFPSLWQRTSQFVRENRELLHPEADNAWLLDEQTGFEYNNCQFFSNFEIGSLNFWRSEGPEKYFNFLDRSGGFYYERYGDAPVHTLSVSLFLPKNEIWFFRDIGYQHDINIHCPPHRELECDCVPTSLDENFYKLVPFKSAQVKPRDTCIRQFLAGPWLDKKEGWSPEAEKSYGGDGYGGYVLRGDEL